MQSGLESHLLLIAFSCSLTCLSTLLGSRKEPGAIDMSPVASFIRCQLCHAGIDNSKARCNLEHEETLSVAPSSAPTPEQRLLD